MTTNEFYYNDGEEITIEEAHALTDKSKLIVADRAVDKAECTAIIAANTMEEPTIEDAVEEDTTDLGDDPVVDEPDETPEEEPEE